MTAKKTFSSIRVRGPARFDSGLTNKGVALHEYREYVARLVFDVNFGELQLFVLHSDFGSLTWVHSSAGLWQVELNEALDSLKFITPVMPNFRDDDGNSFSTGVTLATNQVNQHSRFILHFQNDAGDPADPSGFNVIVNFKLYL